MRNKIFFITVSCSFIVLLWCIFFNALGYNTNSELLHKIGISKSLPEGWGFFTKTPKESMVDLYSCEGGEWEKVDLRNCQSTYFFGASRKARMLGFEISIVISKLRSENEWMEKTNLEYIEFPTEFVEVNSTYLNLLKGTKFALIRREETPWAWRNIVNLKQKHYEILGIKCVEAKN